MWLDALLAYLHYISIFTLIVFLTAEAVVLRPDMTPEIRQRLARYDAVFGFAALAVLITGSLRVFYGAKGYGFYVHNPVFHLKVGLFILVGLMSIVPTINILRWKKQGKTLPNFVPTPAEIAKTRRWVMIESHLIIFIPLAAVLMARGIGM
jgi:putative membrane protein